MLDTLLLDLRYAIRSLRRSPGFTALAVITLGLGIGAATAGFSLLNRVLLRPVPGIRDPNRVGFVTFYQKTTHGNFSAIGVTAANRARLMQASPTIAGIAGWQGPMQLGLAIPGRLPTLARGAFVTGEYLRLLGVGTIRGRLLDSADDVGPSGSRVAVISERLWEGFYGGRPDILDQPLSVNGVTFSVVGVTVPGFQGPDRLESTDFWLPGNTYWDVQHFDVRRRPAEIDYYRDIVRVRPAANFVLATQQLLGAIRSLASSDTSRFDSTLWAQVEPGAGIESGKSFMQHQLALIMGVAGLVLLVACANIANLILFRRAQRRADIVVRASLGAGIGRLVRLFMLESGLLGGLGGLAGSALAWVLCAAFGKIQFLWHTDLGSIPFDLPVTTFAVGVGIAASLLAGIVPALLSTRVNLGADLKSSGPTRVGGEPRLRIVLAGLQVAVSLALVAGAVLFGDTLRNYARLPLGFNPDGVSVFHVDPKRMGYDAHRMQAYYRALTERIRALPGVSSVGLVDLPPFAGIMNLTNVLPPGAPAGTPPFEGVELQASGSYFTTLGITMLRGRVFADADLWPDSLGRVGKIILSADLAKHLFGDRDPLGALVELPDGRGAHAEVVGVASDTRVIDLTGPTPPMMYEPPGAGGFTFYSPDVLVRSSVPENVLIREFREAARAVDGSLPVDPRGSVLDAEAAAIALQHLLFRVVGLLSALTLLLTITGVYGIVAYGVTTRTREFGIRTALGAAPGNLVGVSLRPGLVIVVAGTLAGVAGALYLTKFIAASLYGVSRFDPLAFVTAALVLAAAVLLASWLPARRAAKIDPMVALRYE